MSIGLHTGPMSPIPPPMVGPAPPILTVCVCLQLISIFHLINDVQNMLTLIVTMYKLIIILTLALTWHICYVTLYAPSTESVI